MAALLVLGVLAQGAAAAAPGPNPYRHALGRVDAHLRFAIEFGPQVLGEDLRSSELVCRLAQTSAAQGDAERAAAAWSTLGQLVEKLDAPAAAAIQVAFARAGADLIGLRGKFSAAWRGDRPRVAALRRGVALARRGIRGMRAALRQVEAAFPAWNEHRCDAASAAIRTGTADLFPGLELINRGMRGLWRLADPRPLAAESPRPGAKPS